MSGVSEYIWQTLPCVELREVDRAEDCPCQPASGCKWLKSVHPLPKPLEGRVRSVVSNTGHETFDYLRWEHFQDKTRSRILAERTHPYFTWKSVDSKFHLYVYNRELLESVSVVMVPEDNLSLLQFPSCGKEIKPVCSMLDQPFILDRELQPLVFERTFRSLVNAKSVATNSDVLNNTNDDTASQVPLK